MYKLEKNSPISNISHNVKKFFPNTLWSGNTLLVAIATDVVTVITVHHPSLQASFEGIVGKIGCVLTVVTLSTLAWTVKNFKEEKARWLELGRQIDMERARKKQKEAQQMGQFLTPEQLVMRQFVKEDKVVPIDLFANNDTTSGGRQEEVGFSKVLHFPGK